VKGFVEHFADAMPMVPDLDNTSATAKLLGHHPLQPMDDQRQGGLIGDAAHAIIPSMAKA
jgi:hypothetical protein